MPVRYDVYCESCHSEEEGPVATMVAWTPGESRCPACGECNMTRVRVVRRWGPEPGIPFRLLDLEPMRDRMLVAPLAVSSRSRGGLHMPEISHQRERPQHGIVLRVGPGKWNPSQTERVPLQMHAGDCIFYGKYSGQEFEIAGRTVLNMSEIEVFSLLRPGAFAVVEHDNPKLNHLQGDYCDLCATPEEKAAAQALEQERARLVAERAGGGIETIATNAEPPIEEITGRMLDLGVEHEAKDALEAERERLRRLRAQEDQSS